jgi:hypothetical protein
MTNNLEEERVLVQNEGSTNSEGPNNNDIPQNIFSFIALVDMPMLIVATPTATSTSMVDINTITNHIPQS